MSIYPDRIELDMGTGTTTVVDLLEVEMMDPVIEIEVEAAVVVDIVDEAIIGGGYLMARTDINRYRGDTKGLVMKLTQNKEIFPLTDFSSA